MNWQVVFAHPGALLLALPAALAWWYARRRGHGRWWRLMLLVLLVLAAAQPELAWGRGGSDVVLVLDQSASIPAAERQRQAELVRLAGEQRKAGDRLAVVVFGDRAAVAQGPQASADARLGDTSVGDGGSELAAAVELSAALVPPGRSARVVVHSDGEHTGLDPRRAAARLTQAGIPLDALPVARATLPDAAVIEVELPQRLRLGESFLGAARFVSDARERRRWRVSRGGREIAAGTVEMSALVPVTVTFADRPSQAGLARYEVELEGAEGFATAPAIDPDRLLARLRSLGDGALGALARRAGGDPAVALAQLEPLLRAPEAAPVLRALADPTTRAGALTMLRERIAAQAGPGLAALAVGAAEALLAEAVVGERDRLPLNNRAQAALAVAGGERVLVIGGDGQPGNVSRALEAAGLAVLTRGEGPLALGDLVGCSALVLDEVPADRLGADGLAAIGTWVEHLGGGLLMTGGRRSFGAGGYRASPVERVLPVTMELRDEHRKLAVAMAIAIDISGSMTAPVAGGRIKLDLAAEGAAGTIEMLGPLDRVAVFAVDSAPHEIVGMTPVDDRQRLARQVLGMRPGGGGIYVYQALLAAGRALLSTTAGTRHLVLFADASDAEEPGDYKTLLAEYRKAGITVSVIGMGTEQDSDADFIKDVAARGGGRISFAAKPEDIPRLFAQETVLIARSAWIEQTAPLRPLPGLGLALGDQAVLAAPWPATAGYNLTYARDRAQVLARAEGDPQAPALAVWRIGTGRSAALCVDVDDERSTALLSWGGYGPLLASVVRWTAGGDERDAPGRLSALRAGRSAVLRLELDPARRADWPALPPSLALAVEGDAGEPPHAAFAPVEDGVYEAIVALRDDRPMLPAAAVGGRAVTGPALCLPYPAEAEPRFGRPPGAETLARLTKDTGGALRADLRKLFANPPSPGEVRPVAPLLLVLALLILLGEIAVRRLQLGGWRRHPRAEPMKPAAPAASPRPTAPAASAPPGAPPTDQGLHEALRHLRKRR